MTSALTAVGDYCDHGWTQGIYARDENGQGCGTTAASAV